MRTGILAVAALLAALAGATPASAQAPQCSRSDFEGVVDEAAGALRKLNQLNTPHFQAKLRQLKEKRGWSHDQFLKEAAPLVRDDTITGFDQKSEEFLARITSGGQSGASEAAPDCALLTELRGAMRVLVETQKAKWAYMFAKIDQELTK
jgi:hypothetical protein